MSNPIRQILPDELFAMLLELNLINRKVLRDFEIKREYKKLREDGMNSSVAIEAVLGQYSYLQFDTIRKIIYSIRLPEEVEIELESTENESKVDARHGNVEAA